MNLSWSMAWRLARRGLDWRFKGLRLLLVCLVLGTAALGAIGTLTGAIERELATRGREMLGADLEFTLAARMPSTQERAAIAALGSLSEGARLQAMASVPGVETQATPVELKAVDGKWPLYGAFTLQGGKAAGAPQGMAAWIAPGVADRLGVKVGDRLQVGKAVLRVGGVIESEPDRLAEGFSLGPTVILNRAAMEASGLIQPGSMVRAKLRLKLPPGPMRWRWATISRRAFRWQDTKCARTKRPRRGWTASFRAWGSFWCWWRWPRWRLPASALATA